MFLRQCMISLCLHDHSPFCTPCYAHYCYEWLTKNNLFNRQQTYTLVTSEFKLQEIHSCSCKTRLNSGKKKKPKVSYWKFNNVYAVVRIKLFPTLFIFNQLLTFFYYFIIVFIWFSVGLVRVYSKNRSVDVSLVVAASRYQNILRLRPSRLTKICVVYVPCYSMRAQSFDKREWPTSIVEGGTTSWAREWENEW